MNTRTGNFPIGWRRVRFAWERDLEGMIAWARANDLNVIDLAPYNLDDTAALSEAGFRIGSVDFPVFHPLVSADRAERADAVALCAETIRKLSPLGAKNYFIVVLPKDPSLPRTENFGYAVESFGELAPTLEECGSHIVIEGWPGPGSVVCTPETYGALFREVPSPAMGVNYDPSHLLRMGIDPMRFLREFVGRVYHVHGKDCMIMAENLYQYGHEQDATFAKPFAYGSYQWRYTIPGHGLSDWIEICTILRDNDYKGAISVELEDHYFNVTDEATQLGVLQGVRFLAGC